MLQDELQLSQDVLLLPVGEEGARFQSVDAWVVGVHAQRFVVDFVDCAMDCLAALRVHIRLLSLLLDRFGFFLL